MYASMHMHVMFVAGKQKQYLGAWRNYRSPAQGPGGEDGKEKENASEDKEKVQVYIYNIHVYV